MKTTITFDARLQFIEDINVDESGHGHVTGLAPGASWWIPNTSGGIGALRFVCPCGCGSVGCISVYSGQPGHGWLWNQSMTRPTLHPSILMTTPCRWHGYLHYGEFQSL